MTVLGRVWSKSVRVRRRRSGKRPPKAEWISGQLEWIREHAPGNSFADIGGVWMRQGEVAFTAEEAGARSVTLFDVGDPDLTEVPTQRAERDSQLRYVQGDLEDPQSIAEIGVHDVVWCTGVLYHTPNPLEQLMHLREITGKLLYLGTLTLPEIPGFPQASIFYPYLSAEERRPYAAGCDWDPRVPEGLLAIGSDFDTRPMMGYGNCWWGMTRSALKAMLRTASFEVIEERPIFPSPYITEFVCRPVDEDPVMPPHDYFRRYAQLREATGERLPWEDYYDRERAGTLPADPVG
jgi:hypothetical protein